MLYKIYGKVLFENGYSLIWFNLLKSEPSTSDNGSSRWHTLTLEEHAEGFGPWRKKENTFF